MDFEFDDPMETFYNSIVPGDAANFECNICFKFSQEPIITLCGHLYCWPCLYQWLRHPSHSHECPICNYIIDEEKLVPIFGRGKTNCNSRSRGMAIPDRPMGQRPQTAPHLEPNRRLRHDDDYEIRFIPTAVVRFVHSTYSTLFGVLPAILNFRVHGFHDDSTVYGSTSGAPYLFSNSFHGGYLHGLHHYRSSLVDWKPIVWKVIFVLVVIIILLRLILA